MRWTCHPLTDGLGPHHAAWDGLNRRLMQGHPMLSADFVDRTLSHFGDGRQWLCRLGPADAPAAMCVLQRRGGGLWTTFLPSQAQVGPLLLGSMDQVMRLFADLPGWPVGLDLLCVDPDLVQLDAKGLAAESSQHALTMNVRLEGGFDAYWAARPSGLRQNLRRYERRAVAEGLPLRFVTITAPDEVAAAVLRYAALESRGWKGARGTALAPDNDQGRFYTELMVRYAGRGGALVYELWLGEHLAASRLAICDGGVVVMLKTTYDESLDRHAPGRILLQRVLEQLFRTHAGMKVEFYTDATQDQLAWATGTRSISHWTVFRSHRAEKAVAALRIARHLMRRRGTTVAGEGWRTEMYDDVDALPADAKRLLDGAEGRSLQLGSDWYRALTQAVFRERPVRFCVVREFDTCVAVVPALIDSGRWRGGVSALTNYYSAIYAPALKSGTKARALVPALEALADAAGSPGRMTFAPMDPADEAFTALRAALELAGWVPFRFFCFGNWTLRWQQGWPAYEQGLGGRLRSTIQRMQKRFDAHGGQLQVVQEPQALAAALQQYQVVYAQSWKSAEPFPDFLPALIEQFGPRGCLRIGIATLGGEPIAAQLWFVANGRADIYKLAYDHRFRRYSPGTLLTALMLRQAIEVDRVSEVDYLIGDDAYKKDWMNFRRERWGIVAYDLRTFPGLAGFCLEALGRIGRRLLGPSSGRRTADRARHDGPYDALRARMKEHE